MNILNQYNGRYECDENGTVWSNNGSRKARKYSVGKDGYHRVILSRDGKNTTYYVHRLVWEQFNGEIPVGMTVNHKDMDKGNNALDNLELMTQVENLEHARRNKKWKYSDRGYRVIRKRLLDSEWEDNGWSTFKDAADAMGLKNNGGNICNASRRGVVAYGYLWKRVDRFELNKLKYGV